MINDQIVEILKVHKQVIDMLTSKISVLELSMAHMQRQYDAANGDGTDRASCLPSGPSDGTPKPFASTVVKHGCSRDSSSGGS